MVSELRPLTIHTSLLRIAIAVVRCEGFIFPTPIFALKTHNQAKGENSIESNQDMGHVLCCPRNDKFQPYSTATLKEYPRLFLEGTPL